MATSIDLTGKVALVTGAARGIGAAAAHAYAEGGQNLCLATSCRRFQTSQPKLSQTAAMQSAWLSISPAPPIVKNWSIWQLPNLAAWILHFNNAGLSGVVKPLADSAEEEWDWMIATNLSSVYHCMRFQIPEMLKNGGGVIINTSSVCGSRPLYGLGPYVAAKHGVRGLSSSVALDYGSQGIRCVSIGPGYIETTMTKEGLDAETKAALKARIPQARLGQPEDIARGSAWP